MNENLYALDFELSILSAILFNPDCLSDISEIITPKDFYSKDYGLIFEAMIALRNKSEPIDDKFIIKELGSKLNQSALNSAIAGSGVIEVIKYAKHIAELSKKRQILGIAQEVPQIIAQKPINDAMDEISQKLYSLASDEDNGGLKTSAAAAKLAISEIMLRKEKGSGLLGISSGFGDLDRYTSGLKKGDFIIIAARPGMGKTTFALNVVEKVLSNGVGAVFFSLEMPAEQLMFRMFSSLANVELSKIFKGTELADNDIERISMRCDTIANYDFFIYDGNDISVHKVRSELRRLKEKHPNIGLCVIDYIGLMATSSSTFKERHLQIAEISRSLKILAREMQMPIIALSQLSRNLESRANKKPMLSDLRESGALEQDADMVLFVYREDFYKEQDSKERQAAAAASGKAVESSEIFIENDVATAKIIIGKNRNGPTGEIDMAFHKKFSRFHGVEQERFSPQNSQPSAVLEAEE